MSGARRPKLAVVGATEPPIDINALIRADIQARDWRSCHIKGDRSPPIELAPARPRTWWK